MPRWSNEPPPNPRGPSLRLIRTPAAGKLTAIVTCDDLIGCNTHYWRNRTVPCEAPACDACDQGYSWRWHAYLTCLALDTNEHVILELTATAADPLFLYRETYKTLRGCMIQASRPSSTRNGRIELRTKPANQAQITLPREIDVPAALCHIWSIPLPDVTAPRLSAGLRGVNVEANTGGNHPASSLDPQPPEAA